ncbi:hypothetical protein [Prevotella sp.]|uniref:hypothetical protein n=6 Tax=Prevotella sp. TaxID=59823 RepID=UPI003AB1C476
MRYIKEYFIQLLLIIATPLIINTLMVQPILFPITGDSSSWLSFWGSYIGAVLSSAIALYILYKQNQQNHTENIANRNLQLSVIKYNQELDKLRDLRTALVDFQASFDYMEITNIASKFIDGHFSEEERARLKYLVRDIDEKGFKATLLLDLMSSSNSVNEFNLVYNKIYNRYGLILGDFSSFLDLMQDLPQSKAEKRAYIEKQLNVWETYDKQQEEKVINKISGFTPPKSINEIIKSHGNYENIEEEASYIVKERLLETIDDSSLKENLKKCIQKILSEEQNRIYAILSQT